MPASAGRGVVRRRDVGSATLELAVIAPALVVLVGLVVAGARLAAAAGVVEQAAAAGARQASLARSAAQAHSEAEASVRRALLGQHVACAPVTVTVATAGFAVAAGRAADVRVTVTCTVALSDQAVPGLPGARTLEASAVSVLDTYRGR